MLVIPVRQRLCMRAQKDCAQTAAVCAKSIWRLYFTLATSAAFLPDRAFI